MDIFSLIPIVIAIYGIGSALNKGMAGMKQRGPLNPPPRQQREINYPMPGGLSPMSREFFPMSKGLPPMSTGFPQASPDRRPETYSQGYSEQTFRAKELELAEAEGREGIWGDEGRPDGYTPPLQTSAARRSDGTNVQPQNQSDTVGVFGNEGTAWMEGLAGSEGTAGLEGTSGKEGTSGSEGMLMRESPGESSLNLDRTIGESTGNTGRELVYPDFSELREENFVQGIIWAEVLGKPRTLRPYESRRRV